ncbi:hypothetical protein B0I35DRAFT_280101 [Stachybotrys elegans]|uniref:Uncharacterized protein n=1 Tax=Stachybotrys elegans TaxID=80388 RepID=A0A8K0SPD8_9HYPO|nr:hypothetical protein B0I35DRAFT_280101 [Stachybotrys elegans]
MQSFDFGQQCDTQTRGHHMVPQVTVPMPLEGVYSLMVEQKLGPEPQRRNILNGFPSSVFREKPALVIKDFFETKPNGMEKNKVGDDVLAFASIVLSYAKIAHNSRFPIESLQPGSSPKLATTFMPRTDFNVLFNEVKSKIPGDLFKLFETLACYETVVKSGKLSANIDKRFCTGRPASPRPKKDVFAKLEMEHDGVFLNVKKW